MLNIIIILHREKDVHQKKRKRFIYDKTFFK